MTSSGPEKKVEVAFSFKIIWAEIRVFKSLDWPSSVRGF